MLCSIIALGEFAVDEFVPCVGLDAFAVNNGGFHGENMPVAIALGKHEPAS